jgi:hypothetical protein
MTYAIRLPDGHLITDPDGHLITDPDWHTVADVIRGSHGFGVERMSGELVDLGVVVDESESGMQGEEE